MKKLTLFAIQADNRKKFRSTKIDSKEFESGKASYFDYWPPMQSPMAEVQICKKPTRFES
jgi:hypothetical protein